MEFRQRYLYVGISCLFIMFCAVFVLGYEKPIMASSQQTETDPNSEETATEKSPAPASGTSVKPKEITFELVKGIKFADGTEVKSITKADIETLRDLPIDMGGNKTDGVTLTKGRKTKGRNDKIHVRTCREYDSALEDGYYPSSTYDIAMASWFKRPCKILNLLQRATIPKQSFIPTVKEGLFDLTLFPLTLFPVMSDYEQTYGYNIENETYQDRLDKGLMKVTESSESKLHCEDDGQRQQLTEVTRADFNGDGIEDILLFEAIYAIGGSFRAYHLIILTRKSMDGKYEKVEPHEPE